MPLGLSSSLRLTNPLAPVGGNGSLAPWGPYALRMDDGESTRNRWNSARRVCMVRRMPRVQVYLPDDLHDQLKRRGLPASELLQVALRAELERQDALDATSEYLDELGNEVGEPSARQQASADAIARRIRSRRLGQAG